MAEALLRPGSTAKQGKIPCIDLCYCHTPKEKYCGQRQDVIDAHPDTVVRAE